MRKSFSFIFFLFAFILPSMAQMEGDLDSLLIEGIKVENIPDELVDTYNLKKKKPINDYSMIGVQYGVGMSRTFLTPEFAKQDMIFVPWNVGVTYTKYGKMFGYMPYFGFQTGIFYTQEGYKYRHDKDNNTVPVFLGAQSVVMDVVEVPFMAHCHVDFWKMKVFLNIGLFAGYRLGIHRYAPEIEGVGYHNLTPDYPVALQDEYVRSFAPFEKRFDYGIKGGLGFAFVFDPVEIHFSAAYKHAFGSSFEPDYYSRYYYRYSYQMNVVVSVGLHFQLGRRTGKTRRQIMEEAKKSVFDN